MWYLVYAYIFFISTLISIGLTKVACLAADKYKVYAYPGPRSVHQEPTPLLGGAAIFGTFVIVITVHLFLLYAAKGTVASDWLNREVFSFLGGKVYRNLGGLLAGTLIIFVLGQVDDLKHLTPWQKLAGQLVAAIILVLAGVRLRLFLPYPVFGAVVTVCWVIFMTNAFNLLDNMDGLTAGVTVISALVFFVAVFPQGQTFTAVVLLAFAGSVLGFLYHNFNPARIFMGDAGALLCGYLMSSLSVLSTFYTDVSPSRSSILIPLLVLSVPIFDTTSVILIRIKDGQSIIRGDKRHFSHRLVELGMSQRMAVVFIYLVALVTGLGAILLGRVTAAGAVAIVAQSVGVFAIIALLMFVAKRRCEFCGLMVNGYPEKREEKTPRSSN